jgi:hypothetical protein
MSRNGHYALFITLQNDVNAGGYTISLFPYRATVRLYTTSVSEYLGNIPETLGSQIRSLNLDEGTPGGF